MGACYVVIPGIYHEDLTFSLDPGTYKAEWTDPATGKIIRTDSFSHEGGQRNLQLPEYNIDIALKIVRI